MSGLKVLGVQWDLAWESPEANRARVERLLEGRRPEPETLVVLPEMFSTGFSMNAEGISEEPGGETERWAWDRARAWGVWLVAGWARRDAQGVAGNEAVVVSPAGRTVATYRKRRPFSPGDEPRHYPAGGEAVVFEWRGLGVAPFICYDLRFPEVFGAVVDRRPELLTVIASWPERRIEHWMTLLRARAIEHQAYVVGVNRTGEDPAHRYPGHSVVVDPWGEVVVDAGSVEGVIEATLDLGRLREYREKLPFLEDRRVAA
ncbi:MAG: carbon-nitrogen family hydrolase [Verrucomicrobiae bacterium]|nr:carbon-nitrogen family hydrolase [Verrucomicrobiae bacterium]